MNDSYLSAKLGRRLQHEDVSSTDVRNALDALCTSDLFTPLERQKSFLTYIVEEELQGRGAGIRGKTIAQDVYDRNPVEGKDSENVVRVDARRLRQLLDYYYDTAGAADPVRIHVESGRYRPRFERVKFAEVVEPDQRLKLLVLPVLIFVAGSLIGFGISQVSAPDIESITNLNLPPEPRRTLERQAIFDKSPASLQAVNLAEQARGLIFPIFDRPRQQLVSEVFRRVIELDPDYFGGYAGTAQTLGTLAIITAPGEAKKTLLSSADQMSAEAIRIEPTAAWAQSARGWTEFANGNYGEAMRFARRAAVLAPDDVNVLDLFGSIALFTGNFDEAVVSAEHGKDRRGSNLRFANQNIFAAASFHLGNYEESLAAFRTAAEYGDPISAPSIAFQAAGLNALGRKTEAARKIEELKSAWPEVNLQGLLRGIYQNPDHADAILSHLYELGWNPPSVGD